MKPSFASLRQHYPKDTPQKSLFADIGWTDLIGESAFHDTCAIRMRVALLLCGMSLPRARKKGKRGGHQKQIHRAGPRQALAHSQTRVG